MIQDIYPDKFHNEYRPQAMPAADSPVLCFRGRKVLAKLVESDAPRLEFPTVEMLRNLKGREESAPTEFENGQLIYAFAVNDTEYFLHIWGGERRLANPAADLKNENSQPVNPEVEKETFGAEASVNRKKTQAENTQAEVSEALPEGFSYQELHQIRRQIPNIYGMIVFTGFHLHMWYSGRRFCGYCGAKVMHDRQERAVTCPACGQKNYPRLMPAVIVGVINGDKLLQIKNNAGFHFYALIAGFTEIGETLEETAAREVMEETGLKVKNIRYYKSQPWGIAGDVLAGFYCDLDGDDTITLDRSELALAVWRSRSEIELQPDNYSLTNEMMRRFKEGKEC